MSLLLDLGYTTGLLLASPWVAYRLVRSGGWRGLASRFGAGLGAGLRGTVWLHGSSAGEVSLLKPLVAMLERDRPDLPLVVSAYTPTGYAAARKAFPRHRVILFPLDLSWVVRRFLRRFEPQLVVIVESEFWPNFLLAAAARGVPVALLNGKMSEKSCRAYARTRVMARALRGLRLAAVQSGEHAERLRRLGVDAQRIHVTGNMKYDLARVPADEGESRRLRELLGYRTDDVVVIGGSLHAGEGEALLEAVQRVGVGTGACAPILVPRYPEAAAGLAQHVRAHGLSAVRKTAVDAGEASAPGAGGVLIVDTVGELGRLYGAADAAFVGGSLFYRGSNKGGHNLMEPAVFAVPVLFGPYNFSFKEMVDDLLRENAGMLVRNTDELAASLAELVGDRQKRRVIGERSRRVVLERQGATQRNCELLLGVLRREAARLQGRSFERTMPPASGHPESR